MHRMTTKEAFTMRIGARAMTRIKALRPGSAVAGVPRWIRWAAWAGGEWVARHHELDLAREHARYRRA
jgi:hypothetical protein